MEKTLARDIMATELVNATEDMTVEEALKVLVNYKITGLPVVDKTGKMMGVLSEYDILKQIAGSKKISQDIFQKKITFSKKVDAIADTTPLQKIMEQFVETRYRRLPVIDKKGKLIGIITRRDLMRVFYYRSKLS
jgi:CBS domain-containing protein